MIVLNIGKELVRVESWADIEGRPGFTVDLDPKEHDLSSIIGQYAFAEKIRCGLSNCHQKHLRGYLITTKTGRETNIGKDCGRRYFGVNFVEMETTFDRDMREKLARENLWSLSLRLDVVKAQCEELREAEHGANWVYKTSRALVGAGRGVPLEIIRRISEMLKTGRSLLTHDRLATASETELAQSSGQKVRHPHYVTEAIGEIRGLEALRPENDLRKLLAVDLAENLKIFESLAIDTLLPKDLMRWSKWASTVDAILERAEASTAAGRALLTVENLQQFLAILKDDEARTSFKEFLDSLSTAREPVSAGPEIEGA